jgi:abortive infection bacteriophage resistance protein
MSGARVGVQYTKPALTFEEQLELLERRGVVVEDRSRALETLSRISYYRLSAYFYPLRLNGGDSFHPGTRFDDAVALYDFDRRLRLLVLDGIERVEVLARTRITYELAHACHPFAHAEASFFDRGFTHAVWYSAFLTELDRAKEEFIAHFKAKYDGYPRIPIWMASEVMTFRTLSKMFSGLDRKLQQAVAAALGLHWRVASTWLHCLAYVRNVCAHHGRLWNRELPVSPRLPSGDPTWAPVNNRRAYCVLCMLRYLTRPNGSDAWADAVRALLRETDGRKALQVSMGIPSAWATHAFWS